MSFFIKSLLLSLTMICDSLSSLYCNFAILSDNVGIAGTYEELTILPSLSANSFGTWTYVLSDSIIGSRRLSLQLETSFYLKWRLLKFQFAPFPYADFALITPGGLGFQSSSLYTSLGGGVRMRNENLVFETIEVRAFFFPVAPSNMRGFKVIVTANLRYRYPSSYIAAPDLLLLN